MEQKLNTNKRHYYLGHSYMGINFTYDSPCWQVLVFDNKQKRNDYYKDHKWNDQNNLVLEIIPAKIAYKLAGIRNNCIPVVDWKTEDFGILSGKYL